MSKMLSILSDLRREMPDAQKATWRQLRLWHWRHVLRYGEQAQHYRVLNMEERAKAKDDLAAPHMRWVQALNDLFESGDTAQHDQEKSEARQAARIKEKGRW